MQHSWAEDYNDEWKLLENNSYLTGSFINPEAVKQVLGKDGQTSVSTEEEFEETFKMVSEISRQIEEDKLKLYPRKRKRKIQ